MFFYTAESPDKMISFWMQSFCFSFQNTRHKMFYNNNNNNNIKKHVQPSIFTTFLLWGSSANRCTTMPRKAIRILPVKIKKSRIW